MFGRNSFLKRLKTRNLIIAIGFLFCLGIGWILLAIFQVISNSIILAILLVLTFILISICTQEIFNRFFDKRITNKKYQKKYYKLTSLKDLEKILISKKFVQTKQLYGASYLLSLQKVAYKVTLVTDAKIYFDNINKNIEGPRGNQSMKNIEKFVSYEIFETIDLNYLKQISLFSFQGDRFYFAGFNFDSDKKILTQLNYEEPIEVHKENIISLNEILNIEEINEE